MVSAFASQLQAIAKKSTNELDLKIRRNAHAESLLFERDVAVKQDFETLYNICIDGYRELCQLDAAFLDFERNLFSEQSKAQDRDQMSKAENETLDQVLKRCLILLGGRILLKPAVKALEWLVRRFRVHVHNVDGLLFTLLPYHEVAIWANALSIIPAQQISGTWKFLRPYLKTTWNIPRHAVAFAASTQDSFFRKLNGFLLETCQDGLSHFALMKFWSGITIEAITHRLTQTRSGRKELQDQKTQDLLHMILPLLSEAFEISGSQDLIVTCYTISLVLAAKAELTDSILDSLLLAISQSLKTPDHDATAAIITISVIVQHKQSRIMPRKVTDILSALEVLGLTIKQVSTKHSCKNLLLSLIESSIHNIRRKNTEILIDFVDINLQLLQDLYPETAFVDVLRPIVHKVMIQASENEHESHAKLALITLLQKLNQHPIMSKAIAEFAASESQHADLLEELLGMTIALPEAKTKQIDQDVEMSEPDALVVSETTILDNITPFDPSHGSSFLSTGNTYAYNSLASAFEATFNTTQFSNFTALPVWTTVENKDLLWQTFLLRLTCSGSVVPARVKAIRLLSTAIVSDLACHIQIVVAHMLSLFENDSKIIRRAAGDLLKQCSTLSNESKTASLELSETYGIQGAKTITVLSSSQFNGILSDVILPSLEECILDSSYIETLVQATCDSSIRQDTKRSHSQALFNLLSQHALASPLPQTQLNLVRLLTSVDKVGSKSKRKVLRPIVQNWMVKSDSEAEDIAATAGITSSVLDASVTDLVDLQDAHILQLIAQKTGDNTQTARSSFVEAVFGRLRHEYVTLPNPLKAEIAEVLFEISTQATSLQSTIASETLRQLDLDSDILKTILQVSLQGGNDLRAPPAKRRRRSSSGMAKAEAMKAVSDGTSKITSALELVENNKPNGKPELISVMFSMLATLKQMQQGAIESPYLLNLCLSSIHAMLTSSQLTGNKSDLTAVKPELVTECLRQSDNPQVQNASLLVLSAMAVVTPDRMVHNVMPIFTFIGHNMLSKDDEHSVNVINEAIDKIMPALLSNLKKGRNIQSYQTSLASMLASFTAAYDHIPHHRRVAFYQKLLGCIDAKEAGYMLLVLLVDSRVGTEDFTRAIHELVSILEPSTQLLIVKQLLFISVDVLGKQPKQGGIVFNLSRTTPASEKLQYSRSSLSTAVTLLSNRSLTTKLAKISLTDEIREAQSELQTTFERILTTIKELREIDSEDVKLAKDALDQYLQLASLKDLLIIVTPRLQTMDQELCAQALRILANQIQKNGRKSKTMSEVAAGFMLEIIKLADSSRPKAMVLSSLACIDQVIGVYGRKNVEMVTQAAISLVSLISEKQDAQLATGYLLTAATAIDTMQEASVPVIPGAMKKITALLNIDDITTPTINAIFTLLASIFAHTAFMVSEDQLAHLLALIFTKTSTHLQSTTYSNLSRSISSKTDLDILIGASSTVLKTNTLSDSSQATLLSLLSAALDVASKSTVIRQADQISSLFLTILSIESTSESTHSQTINALNTTSIKYIYKLNDTTFRPIFESWIDWATTPSSCLVLFTLLTHFFETLGAIVTNFANQIISLLKQILTDAHPSPLLTTTLRLLRTITSHDQDSYFANPSHFEIAKPLVSLLGLASKKSNRGLVKEEVLPSIVSLAKATMDSPVTHSQLAGFLCKFKSSEAGHVRLMSILTFVALTEDEDVGDEFVSNVVGIGAGEGEGARGGGGSVGEIMVYVNEMLEDESEEVEFQVRRWVQLVRAKVGEDVFEV